LKSQNEEDHPLATHISVSASEIQANQGTLIFVNNAGIYSEFSEISSLVCTTKVYAKLALCLLS